MPSTTEDVLSPLQQDLQAISAYVNSLQPKAFAAKNTAALALIQQFQGWYQGLGPLDHLFDQETLNEAKRRRNAINEAMGTTIPLSQVPADNPQQVAPPTQWVSDLQGGLQKLPGDAMTIVKGGLILGAGVLLWNLFQNTKRSAPSEPEESIDDRADRLLRHR